MFAFNGLFLVMAFFNTFNIHGVGHTYERTKARIRRFALLLAANIAAASINPYGAKLFIYFFVTNNEITKKYISEWQPVVLKDIAVVIALSVMLFVMWLKREDKPIEISYLLPVLATLIMSGKYMRIVVYLVVCTIILLHHSLQVLFRDKEPAHKTNIVIEKFVSFLLAVSLVFGAEAVFFAMNLIDTVKPDPITPELVTAIDKVEPKRMFTDYNVGGFAIYHGYQSFIDSRADLFPSGMLERAILFPGMSGFTSDDLKSYVDEYNFDSFLLYKDDAVWVWLEQNPDWEQMYSDDNLVFFTKANQSEFDMLNTRIA